MAYLAQALSGLIRLLWTPERIVIRTVIKEVEVRDHSGLAARDIENIEQRLPTRGWRRGMTLEEVAHEQGQRDCIKLFRNHILGQQVPRP